MMSYPSLREAKDQQDYRGFADDDYRPRHRGIEPAEKRSRAFALIAGATAGRSTRDRAAATPARGRHEGARTRRPRLWRRGIHGAGG
jgi:hypothetical protein